MDRVVVITGASAGVGRATARAFAARRRDVALLARGDAGPRGRARATSRPRGGRAMAICRPTSPTPTQSRPRPRGSRRELGPIDVWVNDAMVSVFSPVKR